MARSSHAVGDPELFAPRSGPPRTTRTKLTMLGGIYTALAILGLIVAGLILFAIAWAVLRFERIVDYAAELFENEDGNLADAYGDVAFVPEGLRPAHIATEQNERACTQVTQLGLPSTPPSCGR
jgi:hypothetical protein